MTRLSNECQRALAVGSVVSILVLGATGCGGDDDTNTGDRDGSAGLQDGGATDSSTSADGAALSDAAAVTDGSLTLPIEIADGGVVLCGDRPCQCSDGIDNDGDGVADGFDAECTGPFDDDEGSFATGIPGDNRDPKWQDCFFDGNSGAGDDKCRYRTECLTGELDASHRDCTVSDECVRFCAPRTSNGCDCFGCCEVHLDDGSVTTVQIGDGCSLEQIDDPVACVPCRQNDRCINECGRCELCPGRTIEDLPADCGSGSGDAGGPTYTCDGAESCMSDADCNVATEWCTLGCCQPLVVF